MQVKRRFVAVVSSVLLAGATAFVLAARKGLISRGSAEGGAPAGGPDTALVLNQADTMNMTEPRGIPGRESAAVVSDSPEISAGVERERIEEGPEFWERLYADATLGQIIDERRALFSDLNAATKSVYECLWNSGRFDYAPLEQDDDGGLRIPPGSFKSGELTSIRMDTRAGLVRWVTLPRETFAAQYMQRDRIAWLMEREALLRRTGR